MMLHLSRLALHVTRAALLVILIGAVAVRVHRLAAQSLWYDEAVTAQTAAQDLAALTRWTADDIQPPLYYYVIAGWTAVVGRSEWALRFPSVWFGALTVALAWAVARRLFASRLAGVLAAALVALAPPYVYYAQEARMYTQLTFLGLLAGYALWRAMQSTTRRLAWSFAFVGVATAALYTHYFAAFLLLAYALCTAAALLIGASAFAGGGLRPIFRADAHAGCRAAAPADENGAQSAGLPGRARPPSRGPQSRGLRHRAIFRAAAMGGAILLLYLPWLPAMLTRYRLDRSYWQGALKLGEALRHVAISFTAGAPEMMLEADAVRLLPWFGLAFAVAAGALMIRADGCPSRRNRLSLLVLLVCLLAPMAGILILASRTPKFNARYLMLVSPAYLLVLAGGSAALARIQTPPMAGGAGRRALRRVAGAIGRVGMVAIILFHGGVAATALRNWFTDWAFAKAQWRELAAFVRTRLAADEAVVLVSGHAWPAWNYYAADIPPVRLPPLDILDVEAVLGFEDGPALGQALAGKSGVWLVRWQAEAVDPVGFAPYFLDRLGVEQPQERRFWHVELRHWRLHGETNLPAAPLPAHRAMVNYGHKLALLGWDDPRERQLTVYWQPLNRLTADYRVSLILTDAAGREVGRWDGRPAGYAYPTMRWRPGRPVFGRYPLPLPPAAAAGEYYVSLAIYDDADPSGLDIRDVADNPAGKRVRLGPLRLEAR